MEEHILPTNFPGNLSLQNMKGEIHAYLPLSWLNCNFCENCNWALLKIYIRQKIHNQNFSTTSEVEGIGFPIAAKPQEANLQV